MKNESIQNLEKFNQLLQIIRDIDSEFPIQYAFCLSIVAANEGMSLTQLSDQAGLSLSTISRIVGALSLRKNKDRDYLLLTVKTSKTERRRKELYLSRRGRDLLHNISELLA